MRATILFLILSLPVLTTSCVATSDHVREGDQILKRLAVGVARKFPDDLYLKDVANEASDHARKPAGLEGVFGGLMKWLSDQWPLVLSMLLGGAGIVSTGVPLRKKQQ